MREIEDKLEADTTLRRAIGSPFKGSETDVDGLIACRTWFLALRDRFGYQLGEEVALGQRLWQAEEGAIEFLAKVAEQPWWSAIDCVESFLVRHEVADPVLGEAAAPWLPVLARGCDPHFADAVAKARSTIGWAGVEEVFGAVAEAKRAAARTVRVAVV